MTLANVAAETGESRGAHIATLLLRQRVAFCLALAAVIALS